MKHTKGPWKVVYGEVYTVDNKPIADMVRDDTAAKAGISPAERDQNARLIAAAPELFEAAIGARDMLRECAKQHRQQGDNGHASLADAHADSLEVSISRTGDS